jgi:hypothetical protein
MERWKSRNKRSQLIERLKHPWPIYKRGGGLSATIIRADGTKEELGTIASMYVKRGWGVGGGAGATTEK